MEGPHGRVHTSSVEGALGPLNALLQWEAGALANPQPSSPPFRLVCGRAACFSFRFSFQFLPGTQLGAVSTAQNHHGHTIPIETTFINIQSLYRQPPWTYNLYGETALVFVVFNAFHLTHKLLELERNIKEFFGLMVYKLNSIEL